MRKLHIARLPFVVGLLLCLWSFSVWAAQGPDCSAILDNLKGFQLEAGQESSPTQNHDGLITLRVKDANLIFKNILALLPKTISGEVAGVKDARHDASLSLGGIKYQVTPERFEIDPQPSFLQDPSLQAFLAQHKISGVFATLHVSLKEFDVSGKDIAVHTPQLSFSADALSAKSLSPISLSVPFFVDFNGTNKGPRLRILSLDNLEEVLRPLDINWNNVVWPQAILDLSDIPTGEKLKSTLIESLAQDRENILKRVNTIISDLIHSVLPKGFEFAVGDVPLHLQIAETEQSGDGVTLKVQGLSDHKLVGNALDSTYAAFTVAPTAPSHDVALALRPALINNVLKVLHEKGFFTDLPADPRDKKLTVSLKSPPRVEFLQNFQGGLGARIHINVELSQGLIDKHKIPVHSGFSTEVAIDMTLKPSPNGDEVIPHFVGVSAESLQFDISKLKVGGFILKRSTMALNALKGVIASKINSLAGEQLSPFPVKLAFPPEVSSVLKIKDFAYDSSGHLSFLFEHVSP